MYTYWMFLVHVGVKLGDEQVALVQLSDLPGEPGNWGTEKGQNYWLKLNLNLLLNTLDKITTTNNKYK